MEVMNPLLLLYQKREREVDRILRGPIPMEQVSKACWNRALQEAKHDASVAKAACVMAGIKT